MSDSWQGRAPAGFSRPVTDLLGDVISIDDYLIEHQASMVLVKAQGDSMIGAGIHDGDFLVVERRPNPSIGSIVVAIVDSEFTIKHLQKEKDGYFLQSANPKFSEIRPNGQLEVFGIPRRSAQRDRYHGVDRRRVHHETW